MLPFLLDWGWSHPPLEACLIYWHNLWCAAPPSWRQAYSLCARIMACHALWCGGPVVGRWLLALGSINLPCSFVEWLFKRRWLAFSVSCLMMAHLIGYMRASGSRWSCLDWQTGFQLPPLQMLLFSCHVLGPWIAVFVQAGNLSTGFEWNGFYCICFILQLIFKCYPVCECVCVCVCLTERVRVKERRMLHGNCLQ